MPLHIFRGNNSNQHSLDIAQTSYVFKGIESTRFSKSKVKMYLAKYHKNKNQIHQKMKTKSATTK